MDNLITIGCCGGCGVRTVLTDGAGKCCIEHPRRGWDWIRVAVRVRSDPQYKLDMYKSMSDNASRESFIELFGPEWVTERIHKNIHRMAKVIPFPSTT